MSYAVYVWSAYGVVLSALAGALLQVWRVRRLVVRDVIDMEVTDASQT